jgi:hypothetical protein
MSDALQGWQPDPYGRHELRYFSAGSPTYLVRDGGMEGSDPVTDFGPPPPMVAVAVSAEPINGHAAGPGPTDAIKPIETVAPADPVAAPATSPAEPIEAGRSEPTSAPTGSDPGGGPGSPGWPGAFPGYPLPGTYGSPSPYAPPGYSPYGYGPPPPGYVPHGYPAPPPGYLPPSYPPEAFGHPPASYAPVGYAPLGPNTSALPAVVESAAVAAAVLDKPQPRVDGAAAFIGAAGAAPMAPADLAVPAADAASAESNATPAPSSLETASAHEASAPIDAVPSPQETSTPVGPDLLEYAIPMYAVLVYALPPGSGGGVPQFGAPMFLPMGQPDAAGGMYPPPPMSVAPNGGAPAPGAIGFAPAGAATPIGDALASALSTPTVAAPAIAETTARPTAAAPPALTPRTTTARSAFLGSSPVHEQPQTAPASNPLQQPPPAQPPAAASSPPAPAPPTATAASFAPLDRVNAGRGGAVDAARQRLRFGLIGIAAIAVIVAVAILILG